MMKMLVFAFALLTSMASVSADFVAGKDYVVLSNGGHDATKTQRVGVDEFFSYGCPWCYRLEPALLRWVKAHASQIKFNKVPVVFNPDWDIYAKAYYVARALSLDSTMDEALFKAILKDKRPLVSKQAMIDFFIEKGSSPVTVKSAFEYSTSIEMAVKEGQVLMAREHVTAVPSIVINHRYKTDLQMAKTEERLFQILDFLLTEEKNSVA